MYIIIIITYLPAIPLPPVTACGKAAPIITVSDVQDILKGDCNFQKSLSDLTWWKYKMYYNLYFL